MERGGALMACYTGSEAAEGGGGRDKEKVCVRERRPSTSLERETVDTKHRRKLDYLCANSLSAVRSFISPISCQSRHVTHG